MMHKLIYLYLRTVCTNQRPSLSFTAGRSERVSGADRARLAEQPPRGPAAAAAAPADADGLQQKRRGRAGSILHPDRRPRCQLVNHQGAASLWIYENKTKKKKHHEKKKTLQFS